MRIRAIAAVTVVTTITACNGGSNAMPPGTQTTRTATTAAQLGLWPRPGPATRVCGAMPPGFARCQAWRRSDVFGMAGTMPNGYAPNDLQTAYGLTKYSQQNGAKTTVAIVDAYDDPNAASDLAIYRAQFGLPPCTKANGCFTKHKFAKTTNSSWAQEESLDVDMVSAICPKCRILLVEAATESTSSLASAEQYATARAQYVSNSWSNDEGGQTYDKYYDVKGIAITAATGDSGYNAIAQWPAILPSVIGVGGTALSSVSPRAESAWGGAGSGCSLVYAKPGFQSGVNTGCANRAQADVAAVASPNTGVAVYDSFHLGGWHVFGGTSVATPIIASIFALAGVTGSNSAANLYAHSGSLNDVTTGNNGNCGAPLCTAGIGWDGPTGLGTPNGIAAF